MHRQFTCLVLLAVLVGGSSSPGISQPNRVTVDPSKASVNGMQGYGVWPMLPDHTPGDPTGYEVILARELQPENWLRFPAGKWALPPEGAYRVILEGDFQVSPFPVYLKWVHHPFEIAGFTSLMGVVAAGRVEVAGTCPDKTCSAWLLSSSGAG